MTLGAGVGVDRAQWVCYVCPLSLNPDSTFKTARTAASPLFHKLASTDRIGWSLVARLEYRGACTGDRSIDRSKRRRTRMPLLARGNSSRPWIGSHIRASLVQPRRGLWLVSVLHAGVAEMLHTLEALLLVFLFFAAVHCSIGGRPIGCGTYRAIIFAMIYPLLFARTRLTIRPVVQQRFQ